ncbi:S66 peptidase family protein [Amycolatopsis albispora]|uniref:LD-carboxypeptidase n=1 Tax=Amycolatopsis albispora TaxID=1804986 RepID=A0A344LJZ3_9PSEU|nr:LD-carboxypeptidase [Amycolatopsis albispora]AXB48367.1 LD-carboxypeptidase [Amycolatopsis albispora]
MRPPQLRTGDHVALVAPAGPVPDELLDTAHRTLKSWGLEVHEGPHARGVHPTVPYLAAPDAERAADFTQAWLDPGIRAVFAARGGYGSMRMLDLVDWHALRTAGPKILTGSSDITALHEAVGVHLGLSTLFAPMVGSTLLTPGAADHLHRTLFDPGTALDLARPGATPLVPGRAEGVLIGGNASLLVSSIGAPEHRPADGAIALLEDVTESTYRLDRILTQLLRSGWFDGVRGIVLGSWQDCGPPEQVKALMLDRLGPLGVPMLWEAGIGHVPDSPTVPLGLPAALDADAGTLTALGPALST